LAETGSDAEVIVVTATTSEAFANWAQQAAPVIASLLGHLSQLGLGGNSEPADLFQVVSDNGDESSDENAIVVFGGEAPSGPAIFFQGSAGSQAGLSYTFALDLSDPTRIHIFASGAASPNNWASADLGLVASANGAFTGEGATVSFGVLSLTLDGSGRPTGVSVSAGQTITVNGLPSPANIVFSFSGTYVGYLDLRSVGGAASNAADNIIQEWNSFTNNPTPGFAPPFTVPGDSEEGPPRNPFVTGPRSGKP
jgi:hypothetical protein